MLMSTLARNKKARFEWHILETLEAGISLLGGEVRSMRNKRAVIDDAFVKIMDGEVYLVNAHIPIEGKLDYSPTRSRKLLLKKGEITSINTKIKAKRLTLVPLKMYTKHSRIKLLVATASRKKSWSKKESLKKKDIEREMERELRSDKKKHQEDNRL